MPFVASEQIDTSNIDIQHLYGLVVTGDDTALDQLARECVALWPGRLTVQLHRYPAGPRLIVLAEQTPEDVRRFIGQRITEGVPVEIASGTHVLEVSHYTSFAASAQVEPLGNLVDSPF